MSSRGIWSGISDSYWKTFELSTTTWEIKHANHWATLGRWRILKYHLWYTLNHPWLISLYFDVCCVKLYVQTHVKYNSYDGRLWYYYHLLMVNHDLIVNGAQQDMFTEKIETPFSNTQIKTITDFCFQLIWKNNKLATPFIANI